jgi:hypothetical protein
MVHGIRGLRRVATFLIAVCLALLSSCQGRQAQLEECARAWNAVANNENQAFVVNLGWRDVVIDRSTIKTGEDGCAITFLEQPRGQWVTFTQTLDVLEERPTEWALTRGQAWGRDSPDGGATSVNGIASDGEIRLS